MYRFRKMIERPDWNPPQCLTLEINYNAVPPSLDYDADCVTGGIQQWRWMVVAIRGPIGSYNNPEAFKDAAIRLADEDNLSFEVHDYCLEDFAKRDHGCLVESAM